MNGKNFFTMISDEQIDVLFSQIFNQKLSCNANNTYTEVLTNEAETALVNKLFDADAKKANKWMEFIQQYISHYPLYNQAIDVLLNNIENHNSIVLLTDHINRYGYNEQQGIDICKIVLNSRDYARFASLINCICANGRTFSSEIFRLLEGIEMRMKEAGYTKVDELAKSYKTSVEKYLNMKV